MPAKTKLTDTLLRQIAVLASRNQTQKDIATRLGVSQSLVHIAMKAARKAGYLEDQPRCMLSRSEIVDVENLIHQPELLVALQRQQRDGVAHLRRLRIFDAGRWPGASSPFRVEQYRDRFGGAVARYLLDETLCAVQSMGVTWGATLQSVVSGIGARRNGAARPERVEFFPVCGSPQDAIAAGHRTSFNLVALLDKALNGSAANENNFTGVCASIPSELRGAELEGVRRYFRLQRGYRCVFGVDGKAGLIDRMDAVITSIGTTNTKDNPWIEGAAEAAEVDPHALTSYVLGNIAGLFLPRLGLDAGKRRVVDRVNARWTGIGFEQFLACNRRASASNRGGTLLVAFGRRAEVTLECVRRGLVSELLIDGELAGQLLEVLDARTARP